MANNKKGGFSPGPSTSNNKQKKQMKRKRQLDENPQVPSTKRSRLSLNEETVKHDAVGVSSGSPTSNNKQKKQMKRKRHLEEKPQVPSTKRVKHDAVEVSSGSPASNNKQKKQMKRKRHLEEKPHVPSTKRVKHDAVEVSSAVAANQEKPITLPSGQKPGQKSGQKPTIIMFDLETTDLIRGSEMPHITQIAAVETTSDSSFNCYVLPKKPLTAKAQQLTGIVVSKRGKMKVHGETVQPEPISSALDKFIRWLKKFPNVILMAHYGRIFDFRVLMLTLSNNDAVTRFCRYVVGFIDSNEVFKKAYPGLSSYKQEYLVQSKLGLSYAAHDALEDVKSLGKLVSHTHMSKKELIEFSFPTQTVRYQSPF